MSQNLLSDDIVVSTGGALLVPRSSVTAPVRATLLPIVFVAGAAALPLVTHAHAWRAWSPQSEALSYVFIPNLECTDPLAAYITKIDALASLPANWDGEGAPTPSGRALEAARGAMTMLGAADLWPEVDADVLGGVSLTLYSKSLDRSAWVACMDAGPVTVTLNSADPHVPPVTKLFGGEGFAAMQSFLTGARDAEG